MTWSKTIIIVIVVATFYWHISLAQANDLSNPAPQISRILEAHHIPGVGVALIAKDSIIWIGALGKSDVKNNTPVTINTLFTIGPSRKRFCQLRR
jgi:CubicO group peptidase (beta-lactamase class C family)